MTRDRLDMEAAYLTAIGCCMDLEPEPDARHDEIVIDEFERDEHAAADLRERIRNANEPV